MSKSTKKMPVKDIKAATAKRVTTAKATKATSKAAVKSSRKPARAAKSAGSVPMDGANQLKLAIDAAETAAGLPFSQAVRDEIAKLLGGTFEQQADAFPDEHQAVLKAAETVGLFARKLADLAGANEIAFDHVNAARLTVKDFCRAGAERRRKPDEISNLWLWCE